MKTYLVTGAAGFIGANYIKYLLKNYDDVKIVVLDLLTYAGNLGTIAKDIDNERCTFHRGDIGDSNGSPPDIVRPLIYGLSRILQSSLNVSCVNSLP